ncbi:uncharacterized protein LOC121823533 [Peromyscus maniculatus bairdii]|uniref:uncharacterized protein LOC121823533 n=1 Tax=Peromyscus maniculatus bairdii TaxID=230844 RepID=UPI003FD31A56
MRAAAAARCGDPGCAPRPPAPGARAPSSYLKPRRGGGSRRCDRKVPAPSCAAPGLPGRLIYRKSGRPGGGAGGRPETCEAGATLLAQEPGDGRAGQEGRGALGTRGTEGALEAAGHACPWSQLGLPGPGPAASSTHFRPQFPLRPNREPRKKRPAMCCFSHRRRKRRGSQPPVLMSRKQPSPGDPTPAQGVLTLPLKTSPSHMSRSKATQWGPRD